MKHNSAQVVRSALSLTNPLVQLVIFIRVISAVAMFKWPFWALLVSLVFDWIDAYVLIQRVGYSRRSYHILDKSIDMFTYMIELYIGWQYGLVIPLVLLFSYRMIGQSIFFLTKNQKIFLFFPNIFEVYFMVFVAAPIEGVAGVLTNPQIWMIFSVLVGVKMIQEYILHWFWPSYLSSIKQYPAIFRYFGIHNRGI